MVARGKESIRNAGDTAEVGLIRGSGRSPGEGNGNPLQYSCLENPMDRGVWRATVHRVAKSRTGRKQLSMHAYLIHNVVLLSDVQQSESVTHIHIATLF